MANTCKYYKQRRYVSYNSGATWQPLNEYRKGELYEYDSSDCGYSVTYKWINVAGEYTCSGCTKYQKTQKFVSYDGGESWTAVSPAEYGIGSIIEQGSADCGCGTLYRWYTLPTTEYICSAYTKYNKEVYQVSYDSGSTWQNVVPYTTRIGDVIEYNSADCGYSGVIYKWEVTSGYTCIGVSKYEETQKFESYDNGMSWSAVTPAEYGVGELIESPSTDCGYVPPTPSYSGQYLTFVALESGTFKLSGNSVDYSLDSGSTWTTLASNTESPYVESGQTIMWKAELTPSIDYGVGTFSSSGNYNVEGNPMSLLYGDNFVGQTSLSGKDYAFRNLFSGSTKLISAEKLSLPATTLADWCYDSMFSGCTSLTTAPSVLPATTLATYCYYSMFRDCTSLTTAPQLPAMTLAESCYCEMFRGCTSLTSAPQLPATTLTDWCYYLMFRDCTSLTTAPQLPATTMTAMCYDGMFYGCTSLTNAPVLSATTLAYGCYEGMFQNCTSLTTAPSVLPASTLAEDCYDSMFEGCTSLTSAPQMLAMTLAERCCHSMFRGCTSLTTSPILSASTLVALCYEYMFLGCSSLNTITALFLSSPTSANTYRWVNGVASSGTFYKHPDATWTSYWTDAIPSGWTVVNYS